MKNIYLFQPQYAFDYRKETNYWLPYSAGCLWSYANQFEDIQANCQLKEIIFRREPPDDILDRLDRPSMCGFCCYLWNEQYCLYLAREIKQRWPECVVIFGGPQSNGKMLQYGFIDSIVMAEGEEAFLEALRNLIAGREPEQFYTKRRLEHLDIPSPYTTGLFDPLLEQFPDAVWAMTFETNRGCPYACTFCDWGGITYSKVKKFSMEKVRYDLMWAVGRPITYLLSADANFGIFKDRDIEVARLIRYVADNSRVDGVNVQYAKNSTEIVFEMAKIIGPLSRGITVSVQSMNPDTLEAIKRTNMDIANIERMMELSREHGVMTYTEFILGLPLETRDTWRQGLTDALEAGQHNHIDLWFCQLLENSELSQPASRLRYGIKSINAREFITMFNPDDYREIDEVNEIVASTNTMSLDDMADSYMYGWIILHLHIGNYTQILSRYLRSQGISYRAYYDALYSAVESSTVLGEHFNAIRSTIREYLTTGTYDKERWRATGQQGGHAMYAISYRFVYDNRQAVFDLAEQVAEQFAPLPEGLARLQANVIFDFDQEYPVTISSDYNIMSWSHQPTQYRISRNPRFSDLDPMDIDYYRLRRAGVYKNQIEELACNK